MAFVEDQLTAEERDESDRYDGHQGLDKAFWIPRLTSWLMAYGVLILAGGVLAYMLIARR